MTSLVITLVSVGIGVLLTGFGLLHLVHVDRKIRLRGLLCIAAGGTVQTLGALLNKHTVLAATNAAIVAWVLYLWWNSGGGDGIKRRLKKLAGYLGFGPRTAPSAA